MTFFITRNQNKASQKHRYQCHGEYFPLSHRKFSPHPTEWDAQKETFSFLYDHTEPVQSLPKIFVILQGLFQWPLPLRWHSFPSTTINMILFPFLLSSKVSINFLFINTACPFLALDTLKQSQRI